ncbi:MAG TPA: 12-oxophytodienoate reductase [Pseudolysinimonas sp.]|nr:12-oxophytodienoate reductase [Pseudolysinimonas sp.]
MTSNIDPLLAPFELGALRLRNRFAMAPMTRQHSPGGVPTAEVAEYYRKRAAGGVALVITEGSFIPHDAAGWSALIPNVDGVDVAAGWRQVVDAVHAEGAAIFCQLWHQGIVRDDLAISRNPGVPSVAPSGVALDGSIVGEALTPAQIREIVDAYVSAAVFCRDLGFDGIELHGAHGYLFDQFLWERTNRRVDEFRDPLRFPQLVVREIRRAVGPDFPIVFRFSQWKTDHYEVLLRETPDELGVLLNGLVEAGVDMLHPSTRRFWDPAFPGIDPEMTLAGWTRRLTQTPTIAVGSVGLDQVFLDDVNRSGRVAAGVESLDTLLQLFKRGEFDIVAVGRALLADPEFVHKHARGAIDTINAYEPRYREELI